MKTSMVLRRRASESQARLYVRRETDLPLLPLDSKVRCWEPVQSSSMCWTIWSLAPMPPAKRPYSPSEEKAKVLRP